MRKIPQEVREKQLRELAEADGYSFVGWVDGYRNINSKVTIVCTDHGEFNLRAAHFISTGVRCKICAQLRNYPKPIPQNVRERQLRELAEADGYAFMGWVDGYKNQYSKALINCPSHGSWPSGCSDFIAGRRCPTCSGVPRYSQTKREIQISELARRDGYMFIGWAGNFAHAKTKATINCPSHGDWDVTLNSFVNQGRRCPGCAVTGYASNKPGTLYALISNCKSMIKIGISNTVHRRHIELKSATPFAFSVYRQLHCEDGSQPPMLERMFHNQFPSAELSGFDGATEWCRMSPDVTTWLDLLGAK